MSRHFNPLLVIPKMTRHPVYECSSLMYFFYKLPIMHTSLQLNLLNFGLFMRYTTRPLNKAKKKKGVFFALYYKLI